MTDYDNTAAGSHHRPGGFVNPWPGGELHGFKDFLKWRLVDRRRKAIEPDPPRNGLPRRTPAIVAPRAARDHRAATWIGHSTVLLQIGGVNILTDPVWSDRASPVQWAGPRRLMSPGLRFEDLPDIDVVLQSHNHYDHLDAHTVKRIANRFPNAAWLCPLRVGPLLRSFGVRHLVERDWWQSVETPMYRAVCTPAQHFSARGLGDRNETLWCGWTIDVGGCRVYFAGDTALHPEFDAIGALGPFDVVMLPIGAYEPRWFMRAVHMNPDDAIQAYEHIAGAASTTPACLALHWGTFRLTDEPVLEPPRLFSELWNARGLPADKNWTLAHGETRRF
ncbi:MAG TPA: MBL fold metallo-hydrolase [Gemmatimonadaceae bacterium]|nr:MBL fold metallo-hydrolase [Gemmatimonadaceae bacterium]